MTEVAEIRSRISRPALVAPLILASLLMSVDAAKADGMPNTVSTDAFDSTQGTTVIAHDTIIDPINIFRTTGGFENGHTLMRNAGVGSTSFVNFDTATDISILGVRLFASNDQNGCCLRRAMSAFTLLADTDDDGTFETTVVQTSLNPAYSAQPGNTATIIGQLDLVLMASAVVTARHWRLEAVQGSSLQPFEGARIIELDAIEGPDSDGDGTPDINDVCPLDPDNDVDQDGICGDVDNCELTPNSSQADTDADGSGDACDDDDDNDGVLDGLDNCPLQANPDQADFDGDGAGDMCDLDDDGDGIFDATDACLLTSQGSTADAQGCSIPQYCPCDNSWKNHGAYVSCTAHSAEEFVLNGLITEAEKDLILSDAGASTCGKKNKN